MALTLGEKLRQAREERGISISEVAEQTRISSLYLEGIEADDYRTLPAEFLIKVLLNLMQNMSVLTNRKPYRIMRV